MTRRTAQARLWLAAAAAALLQTGTAPAADFAWTPTTSSNVWSLDTNWTPATNGGPDAPGAFVLINTDIAVASTCVLYNAGNAGDSNKTVGRLDIGDANTTHVFTVAAGTGAGVLEFNGNGSNAQLNQLVSSKGVTFTASITNSSPLDVNNASANLLQFNGISFGANPITLSGGSVTFQGPHNGSGYVVINSSGTVNFGSVNTAASAAWTGGITLNSGTLAQSGYGGGDSGVPGVWGRGVLTINGGALQGGNNTGSPLLISGQVWNTDWSFAGNKTVNLGAGGISLGTAAGTTRTVSNAGSYLLTLGGAISNGTTANSLVKDGTGPILLTGANLYTGTTTVVAGTLQFGKRVALYTANTSNWTAANLIVNSGAVAAFNVGATGEFTSADLDTLLALGTGSGGFTPGAIAGLDTASTNSFTYGSIIANPNGGANALGLKKLGATTLVLSGANTYSGGTILSAGILQLSGPGTLGSGPVSVVGGTLDINNLTKSLGGALTLGGGTAPTVAIGVSGTLTLGGDVTYDSANNSVATISGGAFNLGVPRTFTINDGTQANDLTVNAPIGDGNGIFDVTKAGAGTLLYTPNIVMTTNQTLAVNAGTLTLSGAITGGFSLSKTGAGALKLSGANDTDVSVSSGATLNFDSTAVGFIGTNRAKTVTLRSSTLSVNGNTGTSSVDVITGALICDAAFPGGADIVTVTPNTKSTQLSIGSLIRTNGAVAFFTGTSLGAVPANGVATIKFATSLTPQLVGGGGGAGSTAISILPWVAGSTTAGGGPASFLTYDDSNGLRPLDTATEYATATNFSGTVSANNVRLANLTTTTISNATTINSLYMVNTDGSAQTYLNGTGTLTVTSGAIYMTANKGCTISANLYFGAAQGVIGYSKGKTTYISGGIAGSGGLVFYQVNPPFIQGSGGTPVALSGSATYIGDTYVHGRLDVSIGTFFPYGGRSGDLYDFGLINLNASSRINGLFGDGVLSKNSGGTAIATVGDNNANGTFNGVIANNGSSILGLTKIGSGTQTLNGISTYTAATTVSNGVLAINGALASPVTVWSNAVLTGMGLIATNNAAAVTVNTGGILDPGRVGGVGTLSVTGNVVFAGGQLRVDLDGTSADWLAVSGNVTASGSVAVASASGSGPWKIMTAAAIAPVFTNVTSGYTLTKVGDTELWIGRSIPRGTVIVIE